MRHKRRLCELLVETCPMRDRIARFPVNYYTLSQRARRAETGSPLLDFVIQHSTHPVANEFMGVLKEAGYAIHRVRVSDCPSDYRDLPDRQHPVVYAHTVTLFACFARVAGIEEGRAEYERCVERAFEWLHTFRRQYQLNFDR